MRAVIIDDEVDARITIANFLSHKCPHIDVVGFGQGVKSGVEIIERYNPDVIFLDVKMGDGTGFDLLRKTGREIGKVIFTTAYDEYAIKAIKHGAFDYILKPINPLELMEAINKVQASKNTGSSEINGRYLQVNRGLRIAINSGEKLRFIYSDQVVKIESDGDYSVFTLNGGSVEVCSRSIGEFEKLLSGEGFYRVHNSCVVNCDYIEYISKKHNYVQLIDGTKAEISRRRKTAFVQLMSEH